MKNKNAVNTAGFTLLELLVVVLIIGILAAIALPQYQMAVAKSKFSTLKNMTKSIQQAEQRYYMINDGYPESSKGLDIDINIVSERNTSYGKELVLQNGVICGLWNGNSYTTCGREIFGKQTIFYVSKNTGTPLLCVVLSGTTNDIATKLCANETNKPVTTNKCDSTACRFAY